MLLNLEIVLIGLAVGTIVGLTGVGAAGIMTPLLIIALHVNPMKAVGTDLLYSVPTKLYGAFLHNRQKTVNPEIVKALLYGRIAGVARSGWSYCSGCAITSKSRLSKTGPAARSA